MGAHTDYRDGKRDDRYLSLKQKADRHLSCSGSSSRLLDYFREECYDDPTYSVVQKYCRHIHSGYNERD